MSRYVIRNLTTLSLPRLCYLRSSSCIYRTATSMPCGRSLSSWLAISEGIRIQVAIPSSIRYLSAATHSVLNGMQTVPENRIQQMRLLNAVNDAYGGVVVDMKDPMDSTDFVSRLRASISQWRQQGKKAVWIKLPIELVNLVEAAVKEGFWFHHAEPTYLMLVYWIPKTAHTLPANASHRVGIGAFVMTDKEEILVVQENNGRFKGTGVWKFPTGVVDEGEDICAAAIREVKEEAGIETEFIEVLAFRQSHKSFFGKSDLFFVCMLRALSFNIQKQDCEIEAAQWMPVEEYVAQPFVQEHETFNCIAKICLAKKDGAYCGFSALPTTTGFSAKRSYLYFNNQNMEHWLTFDDQDSGGSYNAQSSSNCNSCWCGPF